MSAEWVEIAKVLAERAPEIAIAAAAIVFIVVGALVCVVFRFVAHIQQTEREKQEVADSCHDFQREATATMQSALSKNTAALARAERVMDKLEPPHGRVRT